MRLIFSSDHAGFGLKRHLMAYLEENGHLCIDAGADSADEPASYVPYAVQASERLLADEADFGIIICGTGLGISMAANKIEGIRAALCTNEYMARMAREHNDANVLALGARVLGTRLAESIVDAFLDAEFESGGRHQERVNEIKGLETHAKA